MEQMVFDNGEQAISSMYTGDRTKDLEAVNAILSGNIEIKKEEVPQEEIEEVPEIEEVIENNEDEVNQQEEDEFDQQRRYLEMIESRSEEEKQRHLEKLTESNKRYAEEKQKREDLEKRLQEISDRQQFSESSTVEEDDVFTSDFDRETRRKIAELESSVKDNPLYKELFDQVKSISARIDEREQKESEDINKRRKQDEEDKVFGSIRQFMQSHSEFNSDQDIKEMDSDYTRFRRDLAYVTGATTPEQLDKYIEDYKNGGEIREQATKFGVTLPKSLSIYENIAELKDFKDGIKYDPILKRKVQITDEYGKPVRYRSLEEAYNVKNYYESITNSKRQAYKDVSQKLSQINSAPTQLPEEVTDTFKSKYSAEEEQDLLSTDPKKWINNPELLKKVKEVYAKRGLELPAYRGRRF